LILKALLNRVTYSINGILYDTEIKTSETITILQTCEQHDILIPRFCYHEKLSIAGNCRMCLIEMEKAPKPIASCALPIANNLNLYTTTTAVKKAREGILEFLLLNHPLDCPICDWGGECDLQDQTQVFGGDFGRYYEDKRSVADKNCGPLIKTSMNRCIQCTRCVRFYSEIAGLSTLGTTGRGSKMEISAYIEDVLDSEISGNLIDLCPVGALTSKPSAFKGRSWEYESFNSIDIFDALNSNIQIDLKGLTVIRIIPRINELINEEWISDKVRFSFDAYNVQRIEKPLMRFENKNNKFLPVSWAFVKTKVHELCTIYSKQKAFFGFFGPLCDLETLLSFKAFFNAYSSSTIAYQTPGLFFPSLDLRSSFFLRNSSLNLKNSCDYKTVLLLSLDLRKESPVLNARFRQFFLKNNKTTVFSIGPKTNYNFSVNYLGNDLQLVNKITKSKHYINSYIMQSKKVLVLVGLSFFYSNSGVKLWEELLAYKTFLKINCSIILDLFFLSPVSSISNAIELNLLNNQVFSLFSKKSTQARLLFLQNVSKSSKLESFLKPNDILIYQGHHGNDLAMKSLIILPSPLYIEKTSHFINLQGVIQKLSKILKPFGEAKLELEFFKEVGTAFNLSNLTNLNNLKHSNFKYVLNLKNNFEYNGFILSPLNFKCNKGQKNCYVKSNSRLLSLFGNSYATDPITEASLTMAMLAKNFTYRKYYFK
jgi:NADH-quinone oxidoreductase chain G